MMLYTARTEHAPAFIQYRLTSHILNPFQIAEARSGILYAPVPG